MQRECGHRFCKICLEKTDVKATCHDCLKESEDEKDHYPTVSMLSSEINCSPDYFLRKELDRLPAHCINPKCVWKGKFKEYKQHCLTCDWLLLECSRCHTKDIPLSMLEDHRKDCATMIVCPLDCGSQIPQRKLSDHIHQELLTMKVTRTGERAKEGRVSVKTISASVIVVMTPRIFHKAYSGKTNNKKKRK
ncbi:TRAF2 [Acanthosepion pharaonis]|uniref:TRAF2 n=1 Tax=Acanthosepion pharaonis TaxID=158019 RepID=A0A812E940_ACAPH|nr:TRAF2 [Sepia pharaonis]